MKNFVLLGAAGYIAPRHLEAIRQVGGTLLAAYDPRDSVGILDSYFPECAFFTRLEDLQSFLKTKTVHFVSICSPNSMHREQIEWGLRLGADVICEKPLVLTGAELASLEKAEKETGRKTYTVLQLRVHEQIRALKKKIESDPKARHEIDLTYITSRGPWYQTSWKGDVTKSGGLSTNIGIHLFDMLLWIFGNVLEYRMEEKTATRERGQLQLEKANVRWDLSIDRSRVPAQVLAAKKATFRNIQIDGSAFEFSEGFTELHKTVYTDVLAGRGYGLNDARPAILLAEKLRAL